MEFKCKICDFSTPYKFNFNRHLNSKKHLINENNYGLKNEKGGKKTILGPKRDHFGGKKRPF
mgnify:FL=1